MEKIPGLDCEDFIKSLSDPPPVSIRFNPLKPITPAFKIAEAVEWCPHAYYLNERPSFTLDPLFHAGCYYVQEASSMWISELIKYIQPSRPQKVLDLCASPGGKSTLLLSLLPEGSILICNEINPERNRILRDNLTRWGSANVIVTQNDVSAFKSFKDYFDIILVDAPCSGEGLFRKDKNAISEWSESAVHACAERQNKILSEIPGLLCKDGYLIYSTCTFEPVENDLQIENLIRQNEFELTDFIPFDQNVTQTKYGYQCYPHKIKGEGFYFSLLRKITGESNTYEGRKLKANKTSELLNLYLENADDFREFRINDIVYAHPLNLVLNDNFKSLYIRSAGLTIGKFKGNNFIPDHSLALFTGIRKDLNSVNLDEKEAIAYLRGDIISPGNNNRGWIIMKYNNQNLGWGKNIGQRINNSYPAELRIKMR